MEFKTSDFRPAIIQMHENGINQSKIAKYLSISRCAVQKAIKVCLSGFLNFFLQRFEETGSNKDRPGKGRKKTARTKQNIQRAKRMIARNPTTKASSVRKLAKKMVSNRESVRRILKKDLKLRPFKFQKRQKLNEEAKKKRLSRCRALIQRFSNGRHRQIVFSDEKLFDIQQVVFRCR